MQSNPQTFAELNFVETCVTENEHNGSVITRSTETCYNSATSFNEYLLIIAVFFLVVFLIVKVVNLKRKIL